MRSGLVAIIDIGSASVGAALLALAKPPAKKAAEAECSQIIFSTRSPVEFQAELNLERFLSATTAALEKVVAELLKSKAGQPDKIICFLSAPFSASQTMIIREERPVSPSQGGPAAFSVTEKWVKEKVAAEVKNLEAKLGQKVFESKIMEIKLDGYASDKPFGQKAKLVEIANYVSLASEAVEKTLRATLIKLFHRADAELHSFSFAFFNTVRNLLHMEQNLLLLDVGGEITEVSLIWHGLLWTNVSYPQGRNKLLRQIAAGLGLGPAETESALKMYLEGAHHEQPAEKLAAVLAKEQGEWLGAFRQALGQIVENCILPERIFIVGNPEFLSLFQRWLAEIPFEELITASKRFTVEPLREELLAHFCPVEAGVARDLSLMMEVIFYDKILRYVSRH